MSKMSKSGLVCRWVLALWLTACQSVVVPSVVKTPVGAVTAWPVEAEAVVQPMAQVDRLQVKFRWPSQNFSTQALDLNKIKYVRIWVQGPGITQGIWNENGHIPLQTGQESTLDIGHVPKGPNRVVTAQGYDENKQLLKDYVLKAFYSSVKTAEGMIKVRLTWRFVPTSQLLEEFRQQASPLESQLDTGKVQNLMDQIIFAGKNPEAKVYTLHPILLQAQIPKIASYITQNGIPETVPTEWNPQFQSNQVLVRTHLGAMPTVPITLTLNDPVSTAMIIPAGSGQWTLTNLPVGTWNLHVNHPAGLSQNATVTVSGNGNITLSKGSAADPFVFGPAIMGVSGRHAYALPTGNVGDWRGEANYTDSSGNNNHGTQINAFDFGSGLLGHGFLSPGTNQYLRVPDSGVYEVATGTLALFFKTNTNYSNAAQKNDYLIGKSDTIAGVSTLALMFPGKFHSPGADGKMRFWIRNTAGSTYSLFSTKILNDNQWHLAVAQWGTGGGKLYIDGQLNDSNASTLWWDDNPAFLDIGSIIEGAHPSDPLCFGGEIDEVQFYNRQLTLDEINGLYQRVAIKITGDGFSATLGNNIVRMGGVQVPVIKATATELLAFVPPDMRGNFAVTVEVTGQTSNAFIHPLKPVVAHFSPLTAAAGATVVIAGAGFDPSATSNTVLFNGMPATITGATATTLTVIVPPGTTAGPLTIMTGTGQTNSTLNFSPL